MGPRDPEEGWEGGGSGGDCNVQGPLGCSFQGCAQLRVSGDVKMLPEGPGVIGKVLKMTFTCFLIVLFVSLQFLHPSSSSEAFASSESMSGTNSHQGAPLAPILRLPLCSPVSPTAQAELLGDAGSFFSSAGKGENRR